MLAKDLEGRFILVIREIRRGLDRKRANRIIIASKTFRHMQISVTSIH